MEIAVVTLFPELFERFAQTSFVGRAQRSGAVNLMTEDLRPFGLGNHLAVDDSPYGGGSGMVLRPDCVVAAMESADDRLTAPAHRVLLSPQGRRFEQKTAERWASLQSVCFVCGRYEGFDERTLPYVHEEASLGDFVLTGGEVAAMAMIEACLRLLPGVLGNEHSTVEESFGHAGSSGLEYPQYTRPVEFRGQRVPDVLRSGDHKRVANWRLVQARLRTLLRRPDLLKHGPERNRG